MMNEKENEVFCGGFKMDEKIIISAKNEEQALNLKAKG